MKRFITTATEFILTIIFIAGCAGGQKTLPDMSNYTAPLTLPNSMPIETPAPPDAVSSATEKESSDPNSLLNAMTENGFWIFSILSDVVLDQELVVSGTFHNKGDETDKVYRKLALYAFGEDGKTVGEEYILTVPKISVYSPNFRIQNGTVKGDIYVYTEGFELRETVVEGNLIFETQEMQNAATFNEDQVKGVVVTGVDAVASASVKESSIPEALLHGMSEKGFWIFSLLGDVTLYEDLVVSGIFHNKGDETDKVYRKLALYAFGEDGKSVGEEYTLTVPNIIVNSPNFRIQNGTIAGVIYVHAENLELRDVTLNGNLIFESQEVLDTAVLDTATINGNVSVAQ